MDLEPLLLAYRNRVPGAKAPLVAALLPQLRYYFLSRDLPPSTAEDLAHDAIVIVLEDLPGLPDRPGRPSLCAWVFTIARNLGLEHHRKVARRVETSLGRVKNMVAVERRGLSSEVRFARQVEDVKQRVEDLPGLEREVIRCDLEEGDPKALARSLNITEPAVRGLRWRAVNRLKTMFGVD